jgi:hypothetical protein
MSNQTGVDLPAQLTKPRTTSFVRESFTSNFWMSSLAILKYIPRSFRVKQVDGNAFFTEAKRDEFRNRVLRITAANPRQWGTMNVSQMLHHLNLSCGGSLGFYTLPDESYPVSRPGCRCRSLRISPQKHSEERSRRYNPRRARGPEVNST